MEKALIYALSLCAVLAAANFSMATIYTGISPINVDNNANTISLTTPLVISYGGTGASSFPVSSEGVVFTDGNKLSNNSELFWNNTNKRLGVGTNSPNGKLHAVLNDDTSQYVYSWDNRFSVFGQSGSTGSALGIGYASGKISPVLAAGQSIIYSLSPGITFRGISMVANGYDIVSTAGQIMFSGADLNITKNYKGSPYLFVRNSDGYVGIGTGAPTSILNVVGDVKVDSGNLKVSTAGKKIYIADGNNSCMGSSTLQTGSVRVNTGCVSTNSRIFLTPQDGNNSGSTWVSGRSASSYFDISSSSSSDSRNVAWVIIEPA